MKGESHEKLPQMWGRDVFNLVLACCQQCESNFCEIVVFLRKMSEPTVSRYGA